MGTSSSKQILASSEGEVLRLGPPASGEVVITVDPKRTGSPFAAGTETILPGAAIPMHRHRDQDEILFVHKGQGWATVEGKSVTVVSGAMLYVPRQTWHGLRNTGTGVLQITWASAPPGIEAFFRELSQLSGPADPAKMQAIAQHHGVEFHPGGEPTGGPPSGRRRRHRGGRGRGHRAQGHQPPPSQGQTPPAASVVVSVQTPGPPATAPFSRGQQHLGRRRRKRHHRPAGLPVAPTSASSQASGATVPSPRPPAVSTPRTPLSSASRPPRGRGRHRRGRVKEVYIDGRWVQVTGEGPVIAPGRGSSGPRRRASRGDEDTATGPLSVPL